MSLVSNYQREQNQFKKRVRPWFQSGPRTNIEKRRKRLIRKLEMKSKESYSWNK